MANPYENQMPNLTSMYGSWNPMSYLKGMQQEDNAAAFNQELATQNKQKTTAGQQDLTLADAMNPQKILQAQLGNATTAARLPGVMADSEKAGLDTKMAKDSYATKLDELIKGHQFKNKERELQQLEMGGRAYMQAEPMLASVPPPARHAAAKRLLGQFYQPEFDQVPPEKLGQVLNFVGSEMMQSQQKLFQSAALADKKGDIALQINDKKIQAQKEIEAYKSTLREKLANIKKDAKPENYEKTAASLIRAAQEETDPERKAILYEEAQVFVSLRDADQKARAAAAQAGKIDVGAETGMATIPVKPAPNVMPGAPAGNNPILNDPNMSKLPQGTKALGNGIYQLPDGRKVKAN